MNRRNSLIAMVFLTQLLISCSSYALNKEISENSTSKTSNVSLHELLTAGEKYHKKRISVLAYLYESPSDGARSLTEKKVDNESFAQSKTTIALWAQKKERKLIKNHAIASCIKITGRFEHFSLSEFVTTIDTANITGMIEVEKVGKCKQ